MEKENKRGGLSLKNYLIRLLLGILTGFVTYGILKWFDLYNGESSNLIIILIGIAGGWFGWYVFRNSTTKKH
jgi:energy-converting hydrogenase Eha subunit H